MTTLQKFSLPFPFFSEFFDESLVKPLSEIFDSFLSSDPSLRKKYGNILFEKVSYPKIDVIQKKDSLVIYSEIPGLTKNDIEIKLEINPNIIDNFIDNENYARLYINGSKQTSKIDAEDIILIKELKKSSFSRSILLNKNIVDIDSYSAKFENGILEITFKLKNENIKNKEPKIKTIEIK